MGNSAQFEAEMAELEAQGMVIRLPSGIWKLSSKGLLYLNGGVIAFGTDARRAARRRAAADKARLTSLEREFPGMLDFMRVNDGR